MRLSLISSALTAAIVGFASTLALVIAAANAVGATADQASSWVTAICLCKACACLYLSWRYRMPMITAWSTAGAALIASTSGLSIGEAVGAFVFTGVLIILTGIIKPLGTLISRIPAALASALLAGILVKFVLAVPAKAIIDPYLVLPMIAVFLLVRLYDAAFSLIAVLAVGFVIVMLAGEPIELDDGLGLSVLVFVMPEFKLSVIISLGIPLYLVTMMSQNLTGFAVLRAAGYDVPANATLRATGLASFVSAFFGAHTSNLAAITAAICSGPDTHPEPGKRWLVAPFYSACYVLFALFGASLVTLTNALPESFILAAAGLALLMPLTGALAAATAQKDDQLAAVATFAVTASGIAAFGIGSAFWGLLAGLLVLGLDRMKTTQRSS